MKAIQLQENMNKILKKLIKTWFSKIESDEKRQDAIYNFFDDSNGLKFLICRILNRQQDGPYFVKHLELQEKSPTHSKEDSSDESMEDEKDFNQDILKFVGAKVGLRLTKKDSISTSLVLKKNDHELLQAAKVVT